jgi:AcrR family transcriptional regulator
MGSRGGNSQQRNAMHGKGVVTITLVDNRVSPSKPANTRVEPVQARSAARVTALLDAACSTMHSVGYEPLTTAMVAEAAGASIGTVYRYFPDRVAVLQAVAARNLERVTEELRARLASQSPATLSSAVAVGLETLTHFFATEQGFRSLRVGDVLDIRPAQGARSGNAEIAAVIEDYLQQTHGVRVDSAARAALKTAVDVMDAVLGRAFMESDLGDAGVLREADRVSQRVIEEFSA